MTVTLISALDASGGGFHAMWTATDTSTAVKDEQDGHNGVKAAGYLNPDGAQVAVENTPTELDPAPGKTPTCDSWLATGNRGGKLVVEFPDGTTSELLVS